VDVDVRSLRRDPPGASLSLYLFTPNTTKFGLLHNACGVLGLPLLCDGIGAQPLSRKCISRAGGTRGGGQCHARFRHTNDEKDSSAELGDRNLMCAKTSNPSSKRFLLTDSVVNSLGFSKFRGFGFAERFKYADYAYAKRRGIN
jgi:hypothetical protein